MQRAQIGFEPERLEGLRPGLLLMALHSLGSVEAAEEAVQETLSRALVALRDGRPADPAKLGAFVAGIARHVIGDTFRARQRLVPLDALREGERASTDVDPLRALVTTEERVRLREALAGLAPADRELLRLCYFEGLSPSELAARLREPAERIRKRKSRALERLRAAFRGSAEEGSRSGAVGDIQDGAAGGPQAAREDADA